MCSHETIIYNLKGTKAQIYFPIEMFFVTLLRFRVGIDINTQIIYL